jgi:glycosyltransferase involved in cell wall biosynthesis
MGDAKIAGKKGPKVCVIVFPSHWLTNRLFLSDLTKILEPITEQLYLISGNLPKEIFSDKVRFIDIGHPPNYNKSIFRISISALRILLIQIKVSLHLLRISKNVDVVIFYLAAFYQLPLLTAKLLGKKTMLKQGGSISPEAIKVVALSPISAKLGPWLIKFNCSLADYIVPKAKRLACEYSNYPGKVLLHGARFVDTDIFTIKKDINQRETIVGYIGRLSSEKGVMNFVHAMPMLLANKKDIKFIIKGDGPLIQEIKEELKPHPDCLTSSIEWVSHEDVAHYMNELKLFVLPSFCEMSPQAVQEAMACGTPVLAAPVGDVPDLIKDEVTGFIMENNSPECIAKNVIRALEYPNSNEVIENAKNLIDREYTYEAAVERYRHILRVVVGSST